MKDRKVPIAVMLGLIIAAVFMWPHIKWLLYTMDVQEAMNDKNFGRFPTIEVIVNHDPKLVKLGEKRGFQSITIEKSLMQRNVGATNFWYIVLKIRNPDHSYQFERRIETGFDDSELDELEEAGVKVIRES